eukprot:TRINITY_DN3495_c0_g1_i2.p1 TRINITY_DN3495_c0_g1~~TRINITY_DN3495_c0_g1_i2.p1  ORF type:complete len:352 (+),score=111.30 TRINITY_DN3495_c0_g1_i2:1133-2188(+)
MTDSAANFRFESLTEARLEEWFDHVHEVFSPISDSRPFFVNHFNSDLDRDIKGILVAIDNDTDRIAAAVHIFSRKMWWDGRPVWIGGLGDVSTKVAYRGKGLVVKLLQKAMEYMETRGMEASSLHASKMGAPLYLKQGWIMVDKFYVKRPFDDVVSLLEPVPASPLIFPLDFDDGPLIDALVPLHASYASKFNGPLVREDRSFWQRWIRNEPQETFGLGSKTPAGAYELSACLSMHYHPRDDSLLVVADFFVSEALFAADRGLATFSSLVKHYLSVLRETRPDQDARTRTLMYSAALFPDESLASYAERDSSTMYRVTGRAPVGLSDSDFVAANSADFLSSKHVFWPVDYY